MGRLTQEGFDALITPIIQASLPFPDDMQVQDLLWKSKNFREMLKYFSATVSIDPDFQEQIEGLMASMFQTGIYVGRVFKAE